MKQSFISFAVLIPVSLLLLHSHTIQSSVSKKSKAPVSFALESEGVKKICLDSLSLSRGERDKDSIILGLGDKNWRIRCAGLEALKTSAFFTGDESRSILLDRLTKEKDVRVRRIIILTLKNFDSPETVTALASLLNRSSDILLMEPLISTLSASKEPMALDACIKLILDRKTGDYLALYTVSELARMRPPNVANALSSALMERIASNGSKGVNLVIIETLGKLKGKDAEKNLSDILKDGDPELRQKAIESLCRLNRDTVIEPVFEALASDESLWCEEIGEMLGGIKSDRAVELFIKALSDKSPVVRAAAALALGEMGRGDKKENALINTLNDDDIRVKRCVLTSLKILRPVKAVDNVAQLLMYGDSEIKKEAFRTLVSMGTKRALIYLLKFASDDSLKDEFENSLCNFHDPDSETVLIDTVESKKGITQEIAFRILSYTSTHQGRKFLLHSLESKDKELEHLAFKWLSLTRLPQAKDIFITRLTDKDETIRLRAGAQLAENQYKEALLPLSSLLKSASPIIREKAVTELGKLASPDIFPFLANVLKDSEKRVREEAARVILTLGNPDYTRRLIGTLNHGTVLPADIVALLGKSKDKSSVPYLKGLLERGNDDIKYAALRALQQIGDTGTVPDIIKRLEKDSSQKIRYTAAAILGEMKGTGGFEALVNALNDGDMKVRTVAARALGKLGNKNGVSFLISAFGKKRRASSSNIPDENVSTPVDDKLAILDALGDIDSMDAVPFLLKVIDSPDFNEYNTIIFSEARNALQSIAGDSTAFYLENMRRGIGKDRSYGAMIKRIPDFVTDGTKGAYDLFIASLGSNNESITGEVLFHLQNFIREQLEEIVSNVIVSAEEGECKRYAEELGMPVSRDMGKLKEELLGLRGTKDFSRLVRAISLDKKNKNRMSAFNDPVESPFLAPLIITMKYDTPSNREWAARILHDMMGDAVMKPFIDALTYDESSNVKTMAIDALGYSKNPNAFAPLIRELEGNLKLEAITALGNLGERDAADYLIPEIVNPNLDICEAAVIALGKIKNRKAVDPLLNYLNMDAREVNESTVIYAIGEIKDTRGLEPLLPYLYDRDMDIRRETAWALGKIRDERAIKPLINALYDPEREVREAAAGSLRHITGQAYYADPIAWENWLSRLKKAGGYFFFLFIGFILILVTVLFLIFRKNRFG